MSKHKHFTGKIKNVECAVIVINTGHMVEISETSSRSTKMN